MEPSCIRQTLIPGSSKLLGDYLYDFEKVADFFPGNFQDSGSVAAAAAQVRFPESRRAGLVSALRQQNPSSPALEKLAQPGTVTVVTGQQVGLFSGPAYTIYKALTAVSLAKQLTDQGVPAVPVFWLATEDHDLAEVDHAWVFNEAAAPVKIQLSDTVATGGPVGATRLGGVHLAQLQEALGELPFASDVTAMVSESYRSGETLGSAFTSLIRRILKDFDLIYLDPMAPSIRDLAAPFLSEAVHHVAGLRQQLRARSAELESRGYHAQVLIEDDASLLFVLDQGKRIPLRWKDGRFAAKDRSYTVEEMQALGGQISPNAVLRPVMQDYLLPTVSYVGGPAEIAYMAQAQVVYQELLGRMPVIYPRNGFTLIDNRASKLMTRYGLRLPDLLDHCDHVRARIAAKLVPDALHRSFEQVRSAILASLGTLQSELHGFDPTLAVAAAKSARKVEYQFSKLAQKTARETLRRDQRATSEANYLMRLIYPHRHLQERFYSIIPFLAKYGLDLPKRLMDEVQLSCPDHMVRMM